MILDKLKAYAFQILSIALLLSALTQTYRLRSEQGDHRDLRLQVAEAAQLRATAALKQTQIDATKLADHAAATQGASDAFTKSQPVRDASARADADRFKRLLSTSEARAATYRAQALASAAACSGLADELTAFDRHIVQGTELVGELRSVVERRDAEVVLLRTQIDIDRELMKD